MQFILFPLKNCYGQTSCVICREDFKKTDRIIQLACQHMWHENCSPPSIQSCPLCRRKIEDQTTSYSRKYQEQFIKDLSDFTHAYRGQIPEEFLSGYDKLQSFIITTAADMNDSKIGFLQTILRIASNLPEVSNKAIAVEWIKENLLKKGQEDILEIFSNREALFYSKEIMLDDLPKESKKFIYYLRQEINTLIDSKEIQDILLDIYRRYRKHVRTEISSMNTISQCIYFHAMTRSEFHVVQRLPEARRYVGIHFNCRVFLAIFIAGLFFFSEKIGTGQL